MTTKLRYNGYEIAFADDDKKVNLTHMWKAADGTMGRRPAEWLRQDDTEKFLESLKKELNGGCGPLLESKPGRYGGTFAHWQIALAYAKYLNPEFHIWCNQAIRSHCQEEADPDLKLKRTFDAYRKRDYSEEWILHRVYGTLTRKDFTGVLKDCGAAGKDYGIATGKINKVVLGMSASEYQKQMGIKKTRDGLSQAQLALIRAIEALAAERIREVPITCWNFEWIQIVAHYRKDATFETIRWFWDALYIAEITAGFW
jgi:hypothetical protein